MNPSFGRLALIGCGLMGGSFALALREAGCVARVVGYSPSAATTARALQLGVVDEVAASAASAVEGADLVLLAVPVAATEATLVAIRDRLAPDCVVMDVGSTKADVVAAAQRTLGSRFGQFVPAHPIAGKELSGVEHAEATLYAGRTVVLTPLAATGASALRRATGAWTAIGARTLEMTPAAHDAAFAAVSHLPHLLAFACFNAIAAQPQGPEFLALAGTGFRDFTRIAASSPEVWRDILLANRQEVLAQSQRFRQALEALEQAMVRAEPGALEALIRSAAEGRAAWRLLDAPPAGTRREPGTA